MKECLMSQLRSQLRKIIPRLSAEANKLRDPEARSRWMRLKQITQSPKSLSKACAFYGWSMDAYIKWGHRVRKNPRIEILLSKSRKPHRSPNKTTPKKEKKVLQLRKAERSHGADRLSDELKRNHQMNVPPSTVYAILKRKQMISVKKSIQLTKKHLKRYRRPFPGYLQMDFKYVPYLINGKQFYQLSCVDHHSSWRFIRIYEKKNTENVLHFLKQLINEVPFYIIEIQTDNDAAFTDKFISGLGVTGKHPVDLWCVSKKIIHRLIPVGVKELNGKVENTHKQDDREFFAKGPYRDLKQIQICSMAYNNTWNNYRRTKALGFKTPNETIEAAYVKAMAFIGYCRNNQNSAVYIVNQNGDAYIPLPEKNPKNKNKTRKKITFVDRYLKYVDWDQKNKKRSFALLPMMSQSYSCYYRS